MASDVAACRKMCQCTNAVVFWPSPDGSMCKYYYEVGQVKMKTYVATGGTVGIAAECLAERKPMLIHDVRIHVKFHEGMDGLQNLAEGKRERERELSSLCVERAGVWSMHLGMRRLHPSAHGKSPTRPREEPCQIMSRVNSASK